MTLESRLKKARKGAKRERGGAGQAEAPVQRLRWESLRREAHGGRGAGRAGGRAAEGNAVRQGGWGGHAGLCGHSEWPSHRFWWLPPPSDIYAIGVGELDVDWRELNELASKKDGERHAFILRDTKALRQVFEHMLGARLPHPGPGEGGAGGGGGEEQGGGAEAAGNLLTVPAPVSRPIRSSPTDVSQLIDTICGVGNMSANASAQERTPWHVTIKVGKEGRGRGWDAQVKRRGRGSLKTPCSPAAHEPGDLPGGPHLGPVGPDGRSLLPPR